MIKLNTLVCMLALTAGIIFCLCGFFSGLPANVTVEGVAVGGLRAEKAIALVREKIEEDLRTRGLKIIADGREYEFNYPEISYKDNLREVIKNVRKGGSYGAEITYYLCGLDEIASGICLNESIPVVEPHAIFSSVGEPFSYDGGSDGKSVNAVRLKEEILASLNGGFEPVYVKYTPMHRKITMSEVRNSTRLLGRFTTYFDGSNLTRVSNIRLAAAKLNGAIIAGGEVLSFNQTVGERIKERGFLPAKIIENGEYVEGVGGGVCQVSTTLYNAALLSGLKVEEYHPHSLAVGYVPPSRDAMVSGSACDLKVLNPSNTPAYIRAQVTENSVVFSVFGKPDGAIYSLESVITETTPSVEEFTDDPAKVRAGKDGIKSECYLITRRGAYYKREKIRSDTYLPTAGYVLSEEIPQEPAETERSLPADPTAPTARFDEKLRKSPRKYRISADNNL